MHQFEELLKDENVAAYKAEGERARAEFLQGARLQPPQQLRLIDCKSTCEENQVVLVDWGAEQQQMGYSAISHTFGMEVYGVFNCECTSRCLAKTPRCSPLPCPQHATRSRRNRVAKDILNMCTTLWSAGVHFIWHDGVCIAQHNKAEVEETTKHMGWIYANANDTIIFLHYVGKPMAPIRHDSDLISRWQTRVWTLQEGAVSRHRRYCVRVGPQLTGCQSLQEFKERLALWYSDDSSNIAVIEEDAYWKIVKELYTVRLPLCQSATDSILKKEAWTWVTCINDWVNTLIYTCFQFPTIATALEFCALRKSKHEGDRINSILALAGVKDFVAPKDRGMEASTIEFFKRQGQQGLARAVFTTNVLLKTINNVQPDGTLRHTWVPILAKPLTSIYDSVVNIYSRRAHTSFVENFIEFTVLQDGKVDLKRELACLDVKFTVRLSETAEQAQSRSLVVCEMDSNQAILAMDLMFDMHSHGFSSSLAMPYNRGEQVSCYSAAKNWACELLHKATRAIPLCCGHESAAAQGTQGPFAWELDNAIAQVAGTAPPGGLLELGRAIVPRLSTGNVGGPVVQGHEIQEGESFMAHLVLPLRTLQRHREYTIRHQPSQIPEWDWSMPALLVQGELSAPVSKIGCFHLKKQLKNILTVLLPSLTTIQKLVII